MKTTWIGWPGIFVEDEAKKEKIVEILSDFNCVPVFHSKEQVEMFLQYHEKVLRPLFHNFKSFDLQHDQEEEQQMWSVYKDFN